VVPQGDFDVHGDTVHIVGGASKMNSGFKFHGAFIIKS